MDSGFRRNDGFLTFDEFINKKLEKSLSRAAPTASISKLNHFRP
jgi:hypothetical protein